MEWMFGNPVTNQAESVVLALQEELEEKEEEIFGLKKELKDEKDLFKQFLLKEIQELEKRKIKLKHEIEIINRRIDLKKVLLSDDQELQKYLLEQEKKFKLSQVIHNEQEKKSSVNDSIDEEFEDCNIEESNEKEKVTVDPTTNDIQDEQEEVYEMQSLTRKEMDKILKVENNVAFIIQRSTNSNTVVYAANRLGGGEINSEKPLDVYWIMYEQNGHPREELNILERNSAYGVSCKPDPQGRAGHYQIVLASLKDREIDLYIHSTGLICAEGDVVTEKGTKRAWIQRVFVQSTTSWGLPTVQYIELFAIDPETGDEVYEKKIHGKK